MKNILTVVEGCLIITVKLKATMIQWFNSSLFFVDDIQVAL